VDTLDNREKKKSPGGKLKAPSHFKSGVGEIDFDSGMQREGGGENGGVRASGACLGLCIGPLGEGTSRIWSIECQVQRKEGKPTLIS